MTGGPSKPGCVDPDDIEIIPQPSPDNPPDTPPSDPVRREALQVGGWFKVLAAGLSLVLAWGAISLVQAVRALMAQAPVLVLPLLLLVGVFVIFLTQTLLREYRAFRQVGRLEEETTELADALGRDDARSFLNALQPRLKALKVHDAALIGNFESADLDDMSAISVRRAFENLVLTKLDERAEAVIEREARNACLAVAILPHPALDAAVVIWRGAGLIRKLAAIYGVEVTGLSSLRLFKHVLESALLAAGAETLGRFIVEEGTGGAFARVIKPLGEAAVTYARMRRLGAFSRKILAPTGQLVAD